MGFLFGFSLPVERLPLLVVGPAVTGLGLVAGYLEWRAPDSSLFWSVVDLAGGIALTVAGVMERRRRTAKQDARNDDDARHDA